MKVRVRAAEALLLGGGDHLRGEVEPDHLAEAAIRQRDREVAGAGCDIERAPFTRLQRRANRPLSPAHVLPKVITPVHQVVAADDAAEHRGDLRFRLDRAGGGLVSHRTIPIAKTAAKMRVSRDVPTSTGTSSRPVALSIAATSGSASGRQTGIASQVQVGSAQKAIGSGT